MNIGLVLPACSAHEDEWHTPLVQQVIRGLSERHTVRVFPLTYPSDPTPYRLYNAQVFPIGGSPNLKGLRRWSITRQIQQLLTQQHQSQAFDVIHVWGADNSAVASHWVGKQFNIPTVVSVIGGELVGFPHINYGLQLSITTQWHVRQALHDATRIIAHSRYIKQLLSVYVAPERHHTIVEVPLGTDTTLFQPPQSDQRAYEYIHVGEMTPVKNQAALLRLLAKLPSATLVLIGDGPLRGELESLAQSLGIDDRVFFRGRIPYPELPTHYQEARFFLTTSIHEAFCLPTIEALACEVGVIGPPIGILSEVGMTAPVDDLQELILKRARKRGDIQRARYRLLVETTYTLRHMLQGLEAVYAGLSPSPTPPADH
ncbi:MAG: glycosyltransferase family 4 protein [Anaerolineales bacterium]|nr:glycosyltransferase family 4 protein [Anaerolineales bacterium]